MPPSPTLLVFTLGPEREARRKRLLPRGHEGRERALHRCCLERILTAGRRQGLALAVSSPAVPGDLGFEALHMPQGGGSFGRRLRRAEARAFALASGPLLLAGADTPDLGEADLAEALARLAAHPDAVVLGPSTDGGIYLLATRRPLGAMLERVAWRTRHARRDLEARLAEAGIAVIRLRVLRDLDRAADLAAWVARPRRVEDPLATELYRLLRPPTPTAAPGFGPALSPLSLRPPGRAPPFPAA